MCPAGERQSFNWVTNEPAPWQPLKIRHPVARSKPTCTRWVLWLLHFPLLYAAVIDVPRLGVYGKRVPECKGQASCRSNTACNLPTLGYYYCCCCCCWPPLWSSGQSSRLQIQRSVFDSRRYQIFWEVVGLERGPLSLVSTIEELPERKSSGSGLENRDYGRRDPLRWPHDKRRSLGWYSSQNFYSASNRNEYQKKENNVSGK
jgi:hypothetical protein